MDVTSIYRGNTGRDLAYMTVDWVAYHSAWTRGTRGVGEAPRAASLDPGRAVGNPIECRVCAVAPGI